MADIPVIMVARNSLALTKLAVKSVLAQDIPVELLVIDNASSDGTGAWLRAKEGIHFIVLSEQKSLAGCWNLGLRNAWVAGYDRALVVNNDVELRSDTARLLWECHAEFVSGIGVDKENLAPRTFEILKKSERPFPDFSCFMIAKQVTDKIGWFDEDYFPAYAEDNDMHVRTYRVGIIACAVDLPFLHHAAGTLKNSQPFEQAAIRRGAGRNRERFRAKYGCLPGSPEYSALFT